MVTDGPLPRRALAWGVAPKELQREVSHRPWSLPPGPWLGHQRWEDAVSVHWPVPIPELRHLVPLSLALDVHEGLGWIGLSARVLARARLRGLPALPTLRSPEVVLHACVWVGHHAGIYELAHHVARPLARLCARALLRAPVRAARMSVRERDGWLVHESRESEGEVALRSRATGGAFRPAAGTLAHFLLERYAYFVPQPDGDVREIGLHHRPWRVRPAELASARVALGAASSITAGTPPRLVLRAEPQDVLLWAPRHATWGPEIA